MFQNINWMNQQSCFNQLIFRMIQMSVSRVQQLRHQNSQLKQRILFIKNQNSTVDLQAEVSRFVEESKKNLNEMHKKIEQQSAKQSVLIHTATAKYQGVLRNQIELLTFNKKLSQDKENQDKVFSEGVEKMTVEYQNRIKAFQSKVKTNVKRIQELSNGGSMIARLLGNPRFRKAMQERGCSLQALENQSKLQEVSQEVQEKDREIQEAEQKSARLDEEMTKMHELIDTMKSLLQNLMKEKENILKQNGTLKEKLRQSEVLIAKLLGESLPEEEEEAEVSQNQQQDKDDEQQHEAGQRQQEGN